MKNMYDSEKNHDWQTKLGPENHPNTIELINDLSNISSKIGDFQPLFGSDTLKCKISLDDMYYIYVLRHKLDCRPP